MTNELRGVAEAGFEASAYAYAPSVASCSFEARNTPPPPEPPDGSAAPILPWVDDGTSWVPRRPTSRVYLNDSFVLPPLQPTPLTDPPPPERSPLQLVPHAAPGTEDWRRARKVHPESGVLCLGCGQFFQPSITFHFTGPEQDELRYQGETYCPCCSGPPEPVEPTVLRGREDDVPESGAYLVVDPDDDGE